jgi:hypothetical protein
VFRAVGADKLQLLYPRNRSFAHLLSSLNAFNDYPHRKL